MTIHCLVSKEKATVKVNGITTSLLKVFKVAAVTGAVVHQALTLAWANFEDAVRRQRRRLFLAMLLSPETSKDFADLRCPSSRPQPQRRRFASLTSGADKGPSHSHRGRETLQ